MDCAFAGIEEEVGAGVRGGGGGGGVRSGGACA